MESKKKKKKKIAMPRSARIDVLENECSLLKTKLQQVEKENQKLKSDVGEHKKKKQ